MNMYNILAALVSAICAYFCAVNGVVGWAVFNSVVALSNLYFAFCE